MRQLANWLQDTVAGTRVLSVIPFVLIVASLFLVAKTFLGDSKSAHAEGRRHSYRGEAATRSTSPVSTPGSAQPRAARSGFAGRFINLKAARSADAAGSERVPGDFLSDLSLAFDQGLHSGLVYLDDIEKEVIFEDWRRLVNSTSLAGMTLRNRKVMASGVERFEISFQETDLRGWIMLLHAKGRWFIVGVGNVRTGKPSVNSETLRMLEMLKREHDRDSWDQPDRETLYGG